MRREQIQKSISLLLAIVFAWTNSVSAYLPMSVPLATSPLGVASTLNAIPFLIPAELGEIKTHHFSAHAARPWIIAIEDAHANYSAQIKIKALLAHLYDHASVHTAFVEGAAGPLDVGKFHFVDNTEKNLEIADALTREGELTGVELFLLEQAGDFSAVGVEDLNLYAENLGLFSAVWPSQKFARTFLRALRRGLVRLSDQKLSRPLRTFLRNWLVFKEGQSDLSHYASILQQAARDALALDFLDPQAQVEWPQLVRLAHLKKIEQQIDGERVREEINKAKAFLRKKNIETPFERLEDGHAVSAEGETLRQFFETFYATAQVQGFNFKDYPVLRDYVAVHIFQDELKGSALDREMEKLAERIFESWAKDEPSQNIVALFKDFLILSKAFSLTLDREEASEFQNRTRELSPSALVRRLGAEEILSHAKRLEPLMEKISDFYQIARLRENALVGRVKDYVEQKNTKRAVFLAGGFHTAGIQELFRALDWNYAVVTPRIEHLEQDRTSYARLITGESPVIARTGGGAMTSEVVQVVLSGLGSAPGADAFALYRGGERARVTRAETFERILIQKGAFNWGEAHLRAFEVVSGFGVCWGKTVDTVATAFIDMRRTVGDFIDDELPRLVSKKIDVPMFQALFEKVLLDQYPGTTRDELRARKDVPKSELRQAVAEARRRFEEIIVLNNEFSDELIKEVSEEFPDAFKDFIEERGREERELLDDAAHMISHAVVEDVMIRELILKMMNGDGKPEVTTEDAIPLLAGKLKTLKTFLYKLAFRTF